MTGGPQYNENEDRRLQHVRKIITLINSIKFFNHYRKIQKLQDSNRFRLNWAIKNNLKIPEELLRTASGEYYGVESRRQI